MNQIVVLVASLVTVYLLYMGLMQIGLLNGSGSDYSPAPSNSDLYSPSVSAPQPAPAKLVGGAMSENVKHSQVQDINHTGDPFDNVYKSNPSVLQHPQISNSFNAQGADQPAHTRINTFPKDQVKPEELLPEEGGFQESNPVVPGHLSNRNYFEAGHHSGLNTQGSSLRNANRQIRSDPLIPRQDVGPWHQSTIEADTNRRPVEG